MIELFIIILILSLIPAEPVLFDDIKDGLIEALKVMLSLALIFVVLTICTLIAIHFFG